MLLDTDWNYDGDWVTLENLNIENMQVISFWKLFFLFVENFSYGLFHIFNKVVLQIIFQDSGFSLNATQGKNDSTFLFLVFIKLSFISTWYLILRRKWNMNTIAEIPY